MVLKERFCQSIPRLWLLGLLAGISSAHICPNTTITVDTLSPGVTQEVICYDTLNLCLQDTFYQQDLYNELVGKYRGSPFVTLGVMNSLQEFRYIDTLIVNDTMELLIPYEQQTINVSFNQDLKGEKPVEELSLTHAWAEVTFDSITYLPGLDTTFIAFYSSYDSVVNFGWGPTTDCIFETDIYFVIDDRIQKRGQGRYPGISVSLQEVITAGSTAILNYTPEPNGNYWGQRLYNVKGIWQRFNSVKRPRSQTKILYPKN